MPSVIWPRASNSNILWLTPCLPLAICTRSHEKGGSSLGAEEGACGEVVMHRPETRTRCRGTGDSARTPFPLKAVELGDTAVSCSGAQGRTRAWVLAWYIAPQKPEKCFQSLGIRKLLFFFYKMILYYRIGFFKKMSGHLHFVFSKYLNYFFPRSFKGHGSNMKIQKKNSIKQNQAP